MLDHLLGQQAALVETDVTRRRTDQARDGMRFHVFGHVKAQQFHAELQRQLTGHFRLADTGGTSQQERTDRLVRVGQT